MCLPLVFSGLLVWPLRAVVGRVELLSLFVVYPPPCRGGWSHTTVLLCERSDDAEILRSMHTSSFPTNCTIIRF